MPHSDNSVNDVVQTFIYENNKQKDVIEKSEENYDMVRGNGWVRYPKLEQKLKDSGVPALNLNLILPIITTIIGFQITNRYDLKAYGVKGTQQGIADNITRILGYFLGPDTDREFSYAALDALISNLGGYLAIDYTTIDDPFGTFKMTRESSFYHLRDSGNEHYDINRGSYHIRSKWMNRDDLLASYPEAKAEINKITLDSQSRTLGNIFGQYWQKLVKTKTPSRLDFINEKDGTFRVMEKWEMERVKRNVIMDVQTDKLIEIPKDIGVNRTMQILQKKGLQNRFIPTTINQKTLYVKTVLGGIELIQDRTKYDVQNGLFPFVNLFTYWIDGQGFANVENLKDYQEEHNKRSVNMLQILNSTANSGYWVRQFGDGELQTDTHDLKVNGSSIGFIGTYKGSRPPEKMQANAFPAGHNHLDDKAIAGLRATGMVGENFQGRAETSGESGKLFNDRVKQNMLSMQLFLDNLLVSYRMVAKYYASAVPKKINKKRVFDIVNEETDSVDRIEVNTNAMNDITRGDFEVVLTPVDNSDSAKQQEWIEKQAMVSVMPPELVPWHLYIAGAPYKDSKKWSQYVEQVMTGQAQAAKKDAKVADATSVAQIDNLLADSESKENAANENREVAV